MFHGDKPFAYWPPAHYRVQCALWFGWRPSQVMGERVGDLDRMIDAHVQASKEAAKRQRK